MSTLAEIESAISRMPVADAESLQAWLAQWLEDQRRMTPEFPDSSESGKAEQAAVRNGIRLFPVSESAGPLTPEFVRELLEKFV